MVLQRAGDDLGRRGRAAIDQHHQRHVGDLGVEVIGLGVVAGAFLLDAAAGQHHGALLEEGVGDIDRLVDEAARIVAQVEDDALGRDALALVVDVLDRLLDADIGLLGEAGQPQHGDIALHASSARRAWR